MISAGGAIVCAASALAPIVTPAVLTYVSNEKADYVHGQCDILLVKRIERSQSVESTTASIRSLLARYRNVVGKKAAQIYNYAAVAAGLAGIGAGTGP